MPHAIFANKKTTSDLETLLMVSVSKWHNLRINTDVKVNY